MKTKRILPIISGIVVVILNGCYKEYIEPGVMTTEYRPVGDITGINISNTMQVFVTQGDTNSLEMQAYSGYLPHIITQERNGTLYVYFDRTLERQHRVYKHEQKIYITLKSLTKMEASGATEIKSMNNIGTENLDISVSGASEVNLSVSATKIGYCNISGCSEVTLTGNALIINDAGISGASKLRAFDLTTKSVFIDVSGASHAEIYVSEELDATASGASKVIYKGNPGIVKQNISGASKIVKF